MVASASTRTMNTSITFPPAAPALKLVRSSSEKWAATLAEERRRLQEDHEALREREANLRDYETRLRVLQAEIEATRQGAPAPAAVGPIASTAHPFRRPSSCAPFADETALAAAWEKLHRARELLEVEQSHVRDERSMIRDQREAKKAQEEAWAQREARLAEREALMAEAMAAQPVASEHTLSAVTRLTRAPFEMAWSAIRGKK